MRLIVGLAQACCAAAASAQSFIAQLPHREVGVRLD
jgi:hypothetical protein